MTIQKIKCYQTDYRKNEYFLDVTDKQKSIKTDGPFTTIYLNPNRKTRIIGFGGAFTESASYVYYNSDHETKKGLSKATSTRRLKIQFGQTFRPQLRFFLKQLYLHRRMRRIFEQFHNRKRKDICAAVCKRRQNIAA